MVEVPDGCFALLDWTGDETCLADDTPVGGLCDTFWDCGAPEFEEFCFTDDDLYRAFLKARAFQLRGIFTREALVESLRGLFGPTAFILSELPGVVRVTAGRHLTETEKATLHLFRQVLPVAPGIRLILSGGIEDVQFFGFGVGWGGLCDSIWADQV